MSQSLITPPLMELNHCVVSGRLGNYHYTDLRKNQIFLPELTNLNYTLTCNRRNVIKTFLH
jgi:hypothetical protein